MQRHLIITLTRKKWCGAEGPEPGKSLRQGMVSSNAKSHSTNEDGGIVKRLLLVSGCLYGHLCPQVFEFSLIFPCQAPIPSMLVRVCPCLCSSACSMLMPMPLAISQKHLPVTFNLLVDLHHAINLPGRLCWGNSAGP